MDGEFTLQGGSFSTFAHRVELLMTRNVPPTRALRRPARAGLAPVELVLWLPILLMVMALFVVFGNAAVWKVRTAAAARHVVWRARAPRTGAIDPPIDFGAQKSSMSSGAAGAMPQLDDPRLRRPVVRGPLDKIQVNDQLLDFSRGRQRGVAAMSQPFPMLGNMGHFEFTVPNSLLDDQFRYWEMGIPSNNHRRIPFIYQLPKAPEHFAKNYAHDVGRIVNASFRKDLYPLDHDEEIKAYTGHYVDFHPKIVSFCELDRLTVLLKYVDEVVHRIQGRHRFHNRILGIDRPGMPSVAEQMAKFHIKMYQDLLNRDGLSAARKGFLLAKIAQYTAFLSWAGSKRHP